MTHRRSTALIVVVLAAGWWALHALDETETGAQVPELPKVLYVTQSAGFAHPVLPLSEEVLPAIGLEHDAFEVDISHDASTITGERLSAYHAVVFYTTGELPMSAQQKRVFLDYVRSGRGFVGIHSASDTFYEWPEYGELVGGYFDNHPWTQEVTVRVENTSHPATRHLGERFTIDDEIYQFTSWARAGVDVLLSLDVDSVDLTKETVHRPDHDFALAWTRDVGDGRMFYTALGHRPEVWEDVRFQAHLVEGVRWAMGFADTDASGSAAVPRSAEPNRLTPEEQTAGWRLLFDGRTTDGWRGFRLDHMTDGWRAVDGALARIGQAGDIVTIERFGNFELVFDWRVEEGGNSGVFFGVSEADEAVWHSGPEYQVLHNEGHPDGQSPITSAGSNYAVHGPVRDVTRRVGEWNEARLVVDGRHVEHWLNGVQLLAYVLESPDWRQRVGASKFAELQRYGRLSPGHLAIQDHGDPVWFRNIKIRTLRKDP